VCKQGGAHTERAATQRPISAAHTVEQAPTSPPAGPHLEAAVWVDPQALQVALEDAGCQEGAQLGLQRGHIGHDGGVHVVDARTQVGGVAGRRERAHHGVAAAGVLDGQHVGCGVRAGGRRNSDTPGSIRLLTELKQMTRSEPRKASLSGLGAAQTIPPTKQARCLTVHVDDGLHDVTKVGVAQVGHDLGGGRRHSRAQPAAGKAGWQVEHSSPQQGQVRVDTTCPISTTAVAPGPARPALT
jgi:hypothetical protein